MSGTLLALWLAASPAPDCPAPVDTSLARALHIQDMGRIRDCLAAGADADTTSERGCWMRIILCTLKRLNGLDRKSVV